MPPKWDGTNERRKNPEDHDHIVRMIIMVENVVQTLKDTKADLSIHEANDQIKFDSINKNIQRFVGGLIVINILIGLYITIRFH